MKRHGKSILCILVVLVVVLANVSAVSITWNWRQNDEGVQFYRYQVDGEDPESWMVVGNDVLSYKLDNAERDALYTLYLQQSYDGNKWSPSSSSTAVATVLKDSVPAESAMDNKEILPSPIVVRYVDSPFGTISVNADEKSVVIGYPESLASYAGLLPSYLNDAYPEIMEYVAVTESDNALVGTYAFLIDDQASLDSYADMLTAELEMLIAEYVSASVEEEATSIEEAVEVVAEEAAITEPVEDIRKNVPFRFTLLFKGGVGNRISFVPFSFENGVENMRASTGLALDFTNIISIGSHFGLGIRSDISTDILVSPAVKGWSNVSLDNFYKAEETYDYDISADIKLMANVSAGPVDFYLGGGVGYSLFNQANTPEANATHTLGQVSIFKAAYNSAWFASALTGIRFNLTDLFSLGAEIGYRFMLPAKAHIASADLIIGFTF